MWRSVAECGVVWVRQSVAECGYCGKFGGV